MKNTALSLVLTLVACGGGQDGVAAPPAPANTSSGTATPAEIDATLQAGIEAAAEDAAASIDASNADAELAQLKQEIESDTDDL